MFSQKSTWMLPFVNRFKDQLYSIKSTNSTFYSNKFDLLFSLATHGERVGVSRLLSNCCIQYLGRRLDLKAKFLYLNLFSIFIFQFTE